ncbi:hypothetical protein WR25_01745 [Diploscapter pachys]|uniref:Mitochondrial carrier protein n=1 Tax=Diploscapter pachys TaxID=2018661 RepID=A0A2A2J5R2_9BILA|nr:hypothetical protein WR25_01745 [Diploscapter pachys]
MSNFRENLQQYTHLVGGIAGGVASTTACHPMDLLKVRYSANEGHSFRPQYTSYWDATKQIVRSEGIRGLYQGVFPSLIGSSLSWGLYFHWYHLIKSNAPYKSSHESLDNFIIGMLAGSAVMTFTNPIWVTKTRLCLQYEHKEKKYKGMVDCLSKIWREEGIRGLYKGFTAGILGTSHGALQFMVYNWMKARRIESQHLENELQLGTFDWLVFSAASKVIATTTTFPYQVLRTRMQDHNISSSRGLISLSLHILSSEGLSGLYKGCLMANFRQLPAAVITYLTYEHVKKFLANS